MSLDIGLLNSYLAKHGSLETQPSVIMNISIVDSGIYIRIEVVRGFYSRFQLYGSVEGQCPASH